MRKTRALDMRNESANSRFQNAVQSRRRSYTWIGESSTANTGGENDHPGPQFPSNQCCHKNCPQIEPNCFKNVFTGSKAKIPSPEFTNASNSSLQKSHSATRWQNPPISVTAVTSGVSKNSSSTLETNDQVSQRGKAQTNTAGF